MDRNRGENAPRSLTHAQKSQFNAIPMGSRYIYTHVNNRSIIAGGTILQNQPLCARRSCSGLRQRRGGDYADSSVNPARLLPYVEATTAGCLARSDFAYKILLLTAASFRGLQTFADPLGQKSIFDWPCSGPATDPVQLEVVLNLLVATATTY